MKILHDTVLIPWENIQHGNDVKNKLNIETFFYFGERKCKCRYSNLAKFNTNIHITKWTTRVRINLRKDITACCRIQTLERLGWMGCK